MPPAAPAVHLTATVTDRHRVELGVERRAHGEVDRGRFADLSAADARALAAMLVAAAETAERQAATHDGQAA
jgi:hypothetical protein